MNDPNSRACLVLCLPLSAAHFFCFFLVLRVCVVRGELDCDRSGAELKLGKRGLHQCGGGPGVVRWLFLEGGTMMFAFTGTAVRIKLWGVFRVFLGDLHTR